MMSIKTVNALSHYTDWTIGHVHSGALGWVAMITIGSTYMVVPRMLGLPAMASTRLMNAHFWTHTIGVVLYAASMWVAGIGQGLMSRALNPDGTLTYAFVEIVKFNYPYYAIRLVGGLLCLAGMVLMAVNLVRTFRLAAALPGAAPAPADVAVAPLPA
jgi:cytochrome c oxidase cbb3-type subunit 1